MCQAGPEAFASSNQLTFQVLGGKYGAVNLIVINKTHFFRGRKKKQNHSINSCSFDLQPEYMNFAEHDSVLNLRFSLCLYFKLVFQAKHVKREHSNRKGLISFFFPPHKFL